MLARLHDLVEVLLKLAHLVGNETERVMNREVLRVREILVEVSTLAVEFSKDAFHFDLHALLRC